MSSWSDGLKLLTSMNLSNQPNPMLKGNMTRRLSRKKSVVQFFSQLKNSSQGNEEAQAEESGEVDGGFVRCKPGGLAALCENTKFTRKEIQLMYRGFKEGCPSGLINFDQLKDIFAQFFPQGDTSEYATCVFNMFDIDSNGQITFDEFVYGLSILSRGSLDEKLNWLFRLYDADRDGLLTRNDLERVVRGMYDLMGTAAQPPISELTIQDHVDYIVDKLDRSGGGLTQSQFVKACKEDIEIMSSFSAYR